MNKRIVLITHLNVFLYATCYWIQSGTLPYLTRTLGADPVMFGQLQTVFAVSQLLGGPIYGRLGDLWGERTALIIAFSSSVATYLLTSSLHCHRCYQYHVHHFIWSIPKNKLILVFYFSNKKETKIYQH